MPTGAPSSPSAWEDFEAFFGIGQRAPLININKFFDKTPNNFYITPNPLESSGLEFVDPDAKPSTDVIQFTSPYYITMARGVINSIMPDSGSPDNPSDTPQSIRGNATDPKMAEKAEGLKGGLDLANNLMAGMYQAESEAHIFTFVYNASTGGYYIVDISKVRMGNGPGEYLRPNDGAAVLRMEFQYNNLKISPHAKLP